MSTAGMTLTEQIMLAKGPGAAGECDIIDENKIASNMEISVQRT